MADKTFKQDRKLAARIAFGDSDALDGFTELFLDRLYAFVYYRAGCDRYDTEEIVQETMLRAVEKIRTYRGGSALFTWLCGMAKFVILEVRRRKTTRSKVEVVVENLNGQIEHAVESGDDADLPSEALERAEQREAVGAAMSSLMPDYQTVLQLKYIDGKTVNEMAEMSGYTPKKVESLLTRARNAFRKAFRLIYDGIKESGLES